MSNYTGKNIVPRTISFSATGLGPAMQSLESDALRVFAWERHNGATQAEAAFAAGYACGTDGSANVQGQRLDHRADVKAARRELAEGLASAEAAKSLRAIIKLRDTAADEKVRLAAARDILDRCGLTSISRHEHTVTHQLSEEQLDRRIMELAQELGLDRAAAEKLLIDPSRVIEGQFVDVAPDPEELASRERENVRRRELAAMTPEQREASKAEVRARRTAEQKAAYADAQRTRQGGQTDLEDFLAADDGSDGLEDLLGADDA